MTVLAESEAAAEAARESSLVARLAVEELRLALKNLSPNHWLMPVFGSVICLMFTTWIEAPVLLTWLAVLTLGGIPLGLVCRTVLNTPAERLPKLDFIAIATASYALYALSWSSMVLLLWSPASDLNHMLLMLLIACTLAGNSALVGASVPMAIVGYSVYGVTLVLLPLRVGGPIWWGLAALAFLFVCYLAYMSRQIHTTARDMLRLRDDKGNLVEALARSKRESDRAREKAETASRAKSQFLANMSHELRTPLNAILGFSEMIHSGVFAARLDRQQEYGKLIHESGLHLLALINDILDLAKIEAGAMALREEDVDLGALLHDCVSLMLVRAQAGDVDLRLIGEAHLPPVRGEARALKQVILNLLSNAIKFTPEGGAVTAFAETCADGGIAFGVRDTGIGIAEEDQTRVFETFGQGRHDVACNDKGTGLGLSIVKGLVELHGGRVTLQSQVGEGSCVTVYLPVERVLAEQKAA